jgi:hypothetical protein
MENLIIWKLNEKKLIRKLGCSQIISHGGKKKEYNREKARKSQKIEWKLSREKAYKK